MGAVPVTYRGVFYPDGRSGKPEDQPRRGTFVGYAWITGLGVGGGPMPGGEPPHPAHPIELPPPVDPPIEEPPPEHPLDQMLTLVAKAPPPQGGWGWFPEYGWVYSPAAGQAGPKRR